MITVDNLRFKLHVRTDGGTLCLPALEREENRDEDGGLSVYFSHFYGIRTNGCTSEVRVWGTDFMTHLKPVEADTMTGPEIGESDCSASVDLTAAEVEKILAELTALAAEPATV